jgi:hypothetical protein
MYGKLKCDIVHLSFSLCVNQLYSHWISALPATPYITKINKHINKQNENEQSLRMISAGCMNTFHDIVVQIQHFKDWEFH